MNKSLNVGVMALTRFHLFDLAVELASRGSLGALYTGYPKYKIPDQLRKFTKSKPLALTALAGARKMGSLRALQNAVGRGAGAYFDKRVARSLEKHDVFVGLSGQSLCSFQGARRLGSKLVCERGSSHILFQDRILREEHELWGLPYQPINQDVIDQELQEYQFCDRIAVPSTFAQTTFLDLGIPKAKIILNPYGVNLDEFQPGIKKDNVFRILFVGNVSVQKGIGYLLRALDMLRGLNYEAWIIGTVSKEAMAMLDRVTSPITYFGAVPRRCLQAYYSQGSVLVLPSIQEGLAVVQAQAMACGVPVIASVNTGASDLYEDGIEGYIVPIRSAEAIADRIERLVNMPELLAEMRQNCLRRVEKIGGWANYGERAVRHYAELRDTA